ncbi:MAG: RHS repeat-associated core domain-containing protein [Vulcanimicrobiota bacterium]
MIPAILGLGGLTARIVATAVIPRVVRAISSSLSTTKAIDSCRLPAVEGISSAPKPAPAPILSGVSAPLRTSRKWGYAGLWHHAPSGLDLATYRAYDAANKRWISRDPLGEGVDYNLYRYCGNNPINLTDPMGLDPFEVDSGNTPGYGVTPQFSVRPYRPDSHAAARRDYNTPEYRIGLHAVVNVPEAQSGIFSVTVTAVEDADLLHMNFQKTGDIKQVVVFKQTRGVELAPSCPVTNNKAQYFDPLSKETLKKTKKLRPYYFKFEIRLDINGGGGSAWTEWRTPEVFSSEYGGLKAGFSPGHDQ